MTIPASRPIRTLLASILLSLREFVAFGVRNHRKENLFVSKNILKFRIAGYPSTIMPPWPALEEGGVTLRVRLGTGGKEAGPVLENG